MKKIIILAIIVLFFQDVMSQQKPLTDVVNINLPAGAKKMSKEKIPSASTSGKKYSVLDKNIGLDVYQIDGSLMRLNVGEGKFPENYLKNRQKGFEGMSRFEGNLPANYTSEITTINNNEVLVIQFDRPESHIYQVYMINKQHTRSLSSTIECDLSDSTKMQATLKEMLKSIKFK